jgi:hypothetical protein
MPRRSADGSPDQVPPQLSSEPRLGPLGKLTLGRRLGLRNVPRQAVEATSSVDPDAEDLRPSIISQLLPLVLLFATIGAATFGAFLIRWDSADTASSRAFASTTQFDEFSAIVSFVVGISAPIAVFTWPTFLQIAKMVSKDIGRIAVTSAIVAYVLLGAAAVFGPFLVEGGNAPFELSHFYVRVGILAACLLTAGAGSFCGLILLWYGGRIRSDDASGVKTAIPAILSARRDLRRFFVGATILVTGSVIIIGGLRSALNADYSINGASNSASIPLAGFILYGVFYTLLLTFALVPAYSVWQTRATSFRDRFYPLSRDAPPSKDWYEGRSNLEELLGLHPGTTSRFLIASAILAPLIGSIIAVIPAIHG